MASAYLGVVCDHALVDLGISNQKTLYAQRDADGRWIGWSRDGED